MKNLTNLLALSLLLISTSICAQNAQIGNEEVMEKKENCLNLSFSLKSSNKKLQTQYPRHNWDDLVNDSLTLKDVTELKDFPSLKKGRIKADLSDNWQYPWFAEKFEHSSLVVNYTANDWFYLARMYFKGWEKGGSNVLPGVRRCLKKVDKKLLIEGCSFNDRVLLVNFIEKTGFLDRDAEINEIYTNHVEMICNNGAVGKKYLLLTSDSLRKNSFHTILSDYIQKHGESTSSGMWKKIISVNNHRLTEEETNSLQNLANPKGGKGPGLAVEQ